LPKPHLQSSITAMTMNSPVFQNVPLCSL